MRGWLEMMCAFAFLLVAVPSADAGNGQLAVIAAVAALAVLATAVVRASLEPAGQRWCLTGGGPPAADERRLHGAFRRLSSPDTPGRPQPRAPGAGHRPV